MTLPTGIFNTEKTDYVSTPMFFGEPGGLYDSINRRHPQLFELYKKLKKMDWDENEFPMRQSFIDFENDKIADINDIMITTLAYQWETDTVASRSVLAILLPFISDSTVLTYYQEVAKNESLHALSYSEIVRQSFRNPALVIDDILRRQAAQDRLQIVADVFEETRVMSLKYAIGELEYSQEVYNQLFKFLVTLYVMERVQFMASFAVTFCIAKSGYHYPIGQTVQKICMDEFEIHVEGGKYILDQMLRTDEGLMAFNQTREWILQLLRDIRGAEHKFVDTILPEGKELTGLTGADLKAYADECILDVCKFLYLQFPEIEKRERSALPWMKDWININSTQGSPMETRQGAYFVGGMVNDLDEGQIEIDL